jgi:cytochrome c oxidase assembly factor CtaG
MNPLHPAFALALFVEAFLLLYLARKWIKINLIAGHSPTIDGLRGFLAFGVFVHHAAIWYAFLKTGQWVVPESRLFTHLGQSTVTLFFMITGFLFYGKMLESRHQRAPVDWLRLYVSRCLRILPLYLLVMLAGIFVIALIRYSGWVQPMQAPWDENHCPACSRQGSPGRWGMSGSFITHCPCWHSWLCVCLGNGWPLH